DEEAHSLFPFPHASARFKVQAGRAADALSALEVGRAHHRLLQFVSLDRTGSLTALKEEGARLERAGVLSAADRGALDWAALAGFWQSPLGRRICGQAERVRRELPFTAKFGARDLAEAGLSVQAALAPEEFFIVQGVVDLAVILDGEIWLVDFKTDQM